MQIRDRIKELRRVKASQLRPNPRNWRTHPDRQRDALRGVLAEVGYADALLARELPDGGLELIDGHLRAETTPDQEVPVLILDVDADEAAKLLAVLDPLAAMADADKDALGQLLHDIGSQSEAVEEMLAGLADTHGIDLFEPAAEDPAQAAEEEGSGLGEPVISFTLVFDDDRQQQTWYRFLRSLKERYPDAQTHGERLVRFIDSLGGD
ncbi:MAG: ParB N-terminal domain-containing protein [Pirellulales bacterium]|nr:ParB N-terminal domain-containing protein [Pirellulales bacterium]